MKLKNIEVGKKYQLKKKSKREDFGCFNGDTIFKLKDEPVLEVSKVEFPEYTGLANVRVIYNNDTYWINSQWLKKIKE